MAIYVTSDLHFCHDKNFCWQERGYSSIEEMNEDLVKKYNSVITDKDIVYILGDCMLLDNEKGIELLKSLKGHKYLAYGNHDSDNRIELYNFYNIFEDIQMGYRIKYKKKYFILTHYPTIVGNYGDEKPLWSLCGHLHTKDKFIDIDKKCYHVEVDAHNNYPVLLDDIIKDLKEI